MQLTIHDQILAGSLGFMAFLTFATLFLMFGRRMAALKSGVIRPGQFKTYATEHEMPAHIVQSSRHYKNLFEMPTLFYTVVLFSLVFHQSDMVTSSLAVLFCLLRGAHTFIHVNSNDLLWRMRIFGISILVLLVMWIYSLGKFFL